MSSDASPRKRDRTLDYLRGFAAGLVALNHGLEYYFEPFAEWAVSYVNLGRVGVIIFFLLSGFLFGSPRTQSTRGKFAWRRIARIMPTYLAALAIYVLVSWGEYSVLAIMINALLLQVGLGMTSIVPPAWTLPIELVFYTVIIIGLPAGRRYYRAAFYFFCAVCLCASAGTLMTGSNLPTTVPLLVAVACFGAATRIHRDKTGKILRGDSAFLVVTTLISAAAQEKSQPELWTITSYAGSVFLSIAIFYSVRMITADLKVLSAIGEVSYSMYLIHPLYFIWVKKGTFDPVVSLAGYAVFVAVASTALYYVVEKPSMRLMKIQWPRPRHRHRSVVPHG